MPENDPCKAKRFWEECFAKTEPDLQALLERDFSPITSRLQEHKVRRVLDLGCGFGH